MPVVALGVILLLAGLNAAFLPREPVRTYWIAVAAPFAGLPIVAVAWWFARLRGFRLRGGDLIVDRACFPVTFSLAGLESVEASRDALVGARKIIGNDGLGAISGRFRSERLGSFRAYLTDPRRGIVLRANAGTFVVSPAQSDAFVDAVRRRTARS